MKTRRPFSIRLFAVLFLVQASCSFIDGMRDLHREADYLESWLPGLRLDHDAMIVILSARLSIALIPISLIWFLRAKFARWLVTLMALGSLISIPTAAAMGLLSPLWLAAMVLKPLAVALLFTRSAHGWFTRRTGDAKLLA